MSHLITRSLCCVLLFALTSTVEASEAIAYRLSDWKEMHYDDPGRAAQHLAAVQKLGCEASQNSHDGHTDVVYRSPEWQALEVASDELAHQWESWLKGAGFETLHGHAENQAHHDHAGHDDAEHDHAHHDHDHSGHDHGPHGAEEVAYRLVDWQTTQIENRNQFPQYVALMKGLGCEVQSDEHDTHTDVSVRCSDWRHIEVSSHKVATGWEGWLRKSGFEVRHTH